MGLNLHHVRYFTAVVQQGSFSRAADYLCISQPAVSKAVRELERHMKASVLDRSASGIALTTAGETLYRYAEQIFLTEQAAELELAHLQGVQQGKLALGASTTIGVYRLPELLARFGERYPGIRLFLDIGTTSEIASRLLQTPLDIAFVDAPATDDRLKVTPLWEDRLVVIAPPDHPLAQQDAVVLAQVLAYPFIRRDPDSATRAFVEDQLSARGIELSVAMEVRSNEAIKELVRVGLGLAMVSEATIQKDVAAGTLTVLPVPEMEIERHFLLLQVAERPLSASAQAFLTLLAD